MSHITLYTTAACPFCIAAKNFLKSRHFSWTEVRVDIDAQARDTMIAATHRTSVPQIIINGVHVGGFDDMIAMDRRGALMPLLTGTA